MGFWVARQTKRLWSDEEKRSICFQTTVPEVFVAQVARRYALNANMIFKWLRDARYAPGPAPAAVDTPCFLLVEIVDRARVAESRLEESRPVKTDGQIEIELAGGHRLRVSGSYNSEALARLIRGLSG